MAPLAAALLLLSALAPADDFGKMAKKPAFKRDCKDYVKDPVTDKSQKTVEQIVTAYLGRPGDGYLLKYDDTPTASPEVGEWYPGSEKVLFKWTPGVFYENYTHNDLNQVKCMLAHEAAHVQLKHPYSDRELLDRKAKELITPEARAAAEKKAMEFDCKPLGGGKFSGYQCDTLYQAILRDPILKDPEFVAIRRQHELEADTKSLHIVLDSKVDGKPGDPWACWSMMFTMPDGPPAKKDEAPDLHPRNAARAAAMMGELQKMGLPQPCL